MRILAIIPARGGSKGVRNKNMRMLAGKPLIWHILSVARRTHCIDDIVVTSDDQAIITFVSQFGAKTRVRPRDLAEDYVPLDPVIFDSLNWYQEKYGCVDYVITIQPTSPLIKPKSIDTAVELLISKDYDSIISVVDDTHMMWKSIGEKPEPLFESRKNRQFLDRIYKETGAFIITKSKFVGPESRFGEKIFLFKLPFEESIDIDAPIDFLLSEALMERMRILIVTAANTSIGTGHFYRALSLADSFLGHEIAFLMIKSEGAFCNMVSEYGFPVFAGDDNLAVELAKNYNIVINDILDTEREYIKRLKNERVFVVNFEDLGDGAQYADLVFNDMYPARGLAFAREGFKYAVMKETFLYSEPNAFRENLSRVIVSFGGFDENNLTLRVLKSIKDMIFEMNLNVKVITGLLYQHGDSLNNFIEVNGLKNYITVLSSVEDMASEMKNVDLGITSNGRTIYEMAAMRIPVMSIAQNAREEMHIFAKQNKGIRFLGSIENVTESVIRDAFYEISKNLSLRREMYNALPFSSLRLGILRVRDEIFDGYRRFKRDDSYDW